VSEGAGKGGDEREKSQIMWPAVQQVLWKTVSRFWDSCLSCASPPPFTRSFGQTGHRRTRSKL